jgi:hypothetical protein
MFKQKNSDVPPGSSSNPPKVKLALSRASQQIDQIQKQLDNLKKTVEKIDCGKYKKK